jgi:hypothetical protein
MTKKRWLLAGTLAAGLIGASVGAGLAATNGGSGAAPRPEAEHEGADSDAQLSGADADAAAAAAVSYVDRHYTSGGRVTEIEVGDGGAAYGVEVVLPDGGQVEVHVDAAFNVVGDEADED